MASFIEWIIGGSIALLGFVFFVIWWSNRYIPGEPDDDSEHKKKQGKQD